MWAGILCFWYCLFWVSGGGIVFNQMWFRKFMGEIAYLIYPYFCSFHSSWHSGFLLTFSFCSKKNSFDCALRVGLLITDSLVFLWECLYFHFIQEGQCFEILNSQLPVLWGAGFVFSPGRNKPTWVAFCSVLGIRECTAWITLCCLVENHRTPCFLYCSSSPWSLSSLPSWVLLWLLLRLFPGYVVV